MRHLLTITSEGTYTIPDIIPYKPVIFTYQPPAGAHNRIPIVIKSGSDYVHPGKLYILSVLAAVTSVSGSQLIAGTPSLIIIPTATELVVVVNTELYGITAMATSGVKAHIFQ